MTEHNLNVVIMVLVWWALNAIVLCFRAAKDGAMPRKDPISPIIDYAAFAFVISSLK